MDDGKNVRMYVWVHSVSFTSIMRTDVCVMLSVAFGPLDPAGLPPEHTARWFTPCFFFFFLFVYLSEVSPGPE